MREARGNIFNMTATGDAIVITTNGSIKNNGECVMGRGIARAIVERIPAFPGMLGDLIQRDGNFPFYVCNYKGRAIVTLPVKPRYTVYDGTNCVPYMRKNFKVGDRVPGWAAVADIQLIKCNIEVLIDDMAINARPWPNIWMPRPGCGAGELDWAQVKPIIEPMLDDRFIVCTF